MSEYRNVPDVPEMPPSGQQPPRRRPSMPFGVAQIIMTAVLVAIAFGAGWFGNLYVNRNNQVSANDANLQSIVQAYHAISSGYVDASAINQKQMAYDAINAMVNSLGDTGHSRFETPTQNKQENAQLQCGATIGIGVFLSGGGSQPLRIDEVIPNSPAAGHFQPGDIILAVNGKSISGMTLDQARPLISGAKGTSVTLTIQRQGVAKPLDVTIVRNEFTPPLVSTYMIPDLHIADIQLWEFGQCSSSNSTDSQLQAALKQAKNQGATGIILDLRDNPGGYLDQAVSVASEFLPAGRGENVYIDRTRTSRTPKPVESGHQLATDLPLVILVNGNTASAAEIVTAAIKYNRPSVHVVGEHTFGTDTILTPVPLADGGVILLGTEGWLTPGGVNVRNSGVVPDQKVAMPSGATQINALLAQEEHLTGSQILNGSDPQLQQAVKDLTS